MKYFISQMSKVAVLVFFVVFNSQFANAKDICAHALYNSNDEAQEACPAVCERTDAKFNGQWTNAYRNVEAAGCNPGQESVCGSNIGDICAGVAFRDNEQAQQACPKIVASVREFNGNWTNNAQNVRLAGCKVGYESVCGCGKT
ncbi:MAG: mannan-binding protein [Pseudomonadota bacterium]